MGLFPGPETRQRNAMTERPLQRHCLHLVIIDPPDTYLPTYLELSVELSVVKQKPPQLSCGTKSLRVLIFAIFAGSLQSVKISSNRIK